MDDDQKPPEPETQVPSDGGEEPPPFRPDPRLVTYLERGPSDDASKKFKKGLEQSGEAPSA
jgi:hypothetical protein